MARTAVVILTWNGLPYLKRFLGSVVEHTLADSVEIWVADNGSADGTVEWVDLHFPGIRILRFDENLGYAGGYARALEYIDADYYVLLNSDIEVTPGWLNPLVDRMDSHPDTAACQPKILSWDNKSYFEYAGAAGGFIDRYGYPFCRGRILNITEPDKGQYDSVMRIFWASGACLMLRASAYREAGGLDPAFFAHMEEIDLCWRINTLGYQIAAIPSSVVYHVGGGSLAYNSPFKTYLNYRNNLFMLRKNLPAGLCFHILFARKFLDAISAFIYLLKLKPSLMIAVVRAHIHYYKAGSRLRLQRREILARSRLQQLPDGIMSQGSILFLYHVKRVRKFSQLSLNKQ